MGNNVFLKSELHVLSLCKIPITHGSIVHFSVTKGVVTMAVLDGDPGESLK